MKQTVVYDSEELAITEVSVCSSVSTFDDIAIKHRRFLSENLAKRIDRELNRFLPKIFYEVEPIIKRKGPSIRIKILDNNIKDEVNRAIVAFTQLYHYSRVRFKVKK